MEQEHYLGGSEISKEHLASGDHAINSSAEVMVNIDSRTEIKLLGANERVLQNEHKTLLSSVGPEPQMHNLNGQLNASLAQEEEDQHLDHQESSMSQTPMIQLVKMSKLLSCEVCKTLPMTSWTVHACVSGHQTCGHCFSDNQDLCIVCQKPLECRNKVVEEVLQRLWRFCPDLFPCETLSTLDSELQLKLEAAEKAELAAPIFNHSCHKVLMCPHEICKRRITSNGIQAHFEFDHPLVPVVLTSLNCINHFQLPWKCLEDDLTRAVAVLQVGVTSKNLERLHIKPDQKTEQQVPSFAVQRDTVLCVLLSASVELDGTTYIATWCSSMYQDKGPLTYTLGVQVGNSSRYFLTGLTRSLHNFEEPEVILRDSQCLLFTASEIIDLILDQNEGYISLDIHFTLNL